MMKQSSVTVAGTNSPSHQREMAAEQPEHQQQHGFDQQRQHELALQPAPPPPVDQNRRAAGAHQERRQRADAGQRERDVAERGLIGDRRHDAARDVYCLTAR
jgi:hypothetical protein